jgi:glycosyltransferase involved in cell wall biosynthesis
MRTASQGRLLFVCPNLEPGGAERQWAALAPGLAERGFDVKVLTLDGRGGLFDELRGQGITVHCAGLRSRADPIGLARALRLAGSRSTAVISRSVSADVVAHVLARRQRAPHVITEHLGPDPLGLRALQPHQRLLLRPVRPRATAVVAVADSQRAHLIRLGYRPEAIRVIANGVANDPPVRPRDETRAQLGVEDDMFLAVLAAPLRREKQVPVFVEQVTAAHAVDPRVTGLVVGEGPEAPAVAPAGARSGGAVRMTGFRADAVDVMHAADVVCLTSAAEALPMSLLEAMSVSRPVIATRVGDVPVVVADGETGCVVAPDAPAAVARALLRLARDRAHCAELGRAGRLRQQRLFSAERMVDRYADLLSSLDSPASRR